MKPGLCLLFATVVRLQAELIIGTADLNSGNSFPFGRSFGPGTVYQQAYAATDFGSPLDITSISFFRTMFGNASDSLTNATYTIELSYSANPVDGLDTVNFANNIGAGQVTFGTYALSGMAAGSGHAFVENNSDFVYNPAHGPLLVEIDLSSISGTRGTVFLDAMVGSSGLFSRAHDFGGGFSDIGLVTGFDVAPVPEPETIPVICGGILAVTFLRRRIV